nr:uncharacterized protein LOC123761638 [Procambarus clarkii]
MFTSGKHQPRTPSRETPRTRRETPRTGQDTHWTTPQETHFALPQETHFTLPQETHFTLPQETHWTTPQETHWTTPQETHWTTPQETHWTTPHETHYTTPHETHYTTPHETHYTTPHETHYTTPHETHWSTPHETHWSTPHETPTRARVQDSLHLHPNESCDTLDSATVSTNQYDNFNRSGGAMMLEGASWSAAGGGAVAAEPSEYQGPATPPTDDGHTSLLFKEKWYEKPPQTDPRLEKKRQQALRSLKQRCKCKQREEEQRVMLERLPHQITDLRRERDMRTQTVAVLEDLLHQCQIHTQDRCEVSSTNTSSGQANGC